MASRRLGSISKPPLRSPIRGRLAHRRDMPNLARIDVAVATQREMKCTWSGGYLRAQEILARGKPDELVLESADEAQVVVNVARVEMMRTILQFPFWDEDDPRHDAAHEERFHDIVNGLFEKTVSYVGQEFEVVTKI